MKKSLDSFIRKALSEGYGEETVDRKNNKGKVQLWALQKTPGRTLKNGRTFYQEWKKAFAWLQFNEPEQTMSYINDKGCCIFCWQVQNSVMADSGTKTSNKDRELAYIRFLENGLPLTSDLLSWNWKMQMLMLWLPLGTLVWLNLVSKVGNVKQLPSDLMEQACMLEDKIELLNYMWKFPGSLVCTA